MRAAWVLGIVNGLTCALFLGAGQGAFAEELRPATPTVDTKTSAYRSAILTISPEDLFQDSEFGGALQRRAATFANQLKQENNRFEATLAQEEKNLTILRKTIAADSFASMAAAFDRKVERIRNEQEEKSLKLNQEMEANRKYFFDAVLPVLGEIMKKYGALLIVDKSAVFVSFDRIDITAEAATLIDQTLALVPDISDPLVPIELDVPNQGN